jgi:hypothetical protein
MPPFRTGGPGQQKETPPVPNNHRPPHVGSAFEDAEFLAAAERFFVADRALARMYAHYGEADPPDELRDAVLLFWDQCRRQVEAIRPGTFVGRLVKESVDASIRTMFGVTEPSGCAG